MHLCVQALGLAVPLATDRQRCRHECSAQHVAEFYAAAAAWLRRAARAALPLTGPALRPPPQAACPCTLVSSWIQVLLGYIVPAAVIDYSTATGPTWYIPWRSQARSASGGGGAGSSQGSVQELRITLQSAHQAVLYLGLLTVAAAVSWEWWDLMWRVWPAAG